VARAGTEMLVQRTLQNPLRWPGRAGCRIRQRRGRRLKRRRWRWRLSAGCRNSSSRFSFAASGDAPDVCHTGRGGGAACAVTVQAARSTSTPRAPSQLTLAAGGCGRLLSVRTFGPSYPARPPPPRRRRHKVRKSGDGGRVGRIGTEPGKNRDYAPPPPIDLGLGASRLF